MWGWAFAVEDGLGEELKLLAARRASDFGLWASGRRGVVKARRDKCKAL